MARQFRLSDHSIIAFVAASDPDRARKFYVDTLGLALVSDDKPIALVFDADGTMLRVTIVQKGTPSSICRTRLDSAERRSRRRKPCRQPASISNAPGIERMISASGRRPVVASRVVQRILTTTR